MNKKLSELINQILKHDIENIKEKKINNFPKKIKNKKNKEPKKKNIVDMLKNIADDFSNKNKNKSFSKQSLSDYDTLIPESYKLNFSHGNNYFEGHYKNITNEYKKYNKTKTLSYSTMATEIDHKNKQDALTIIKDKKENKQDSFLFDADTKRSVEAYKWQSISWWHFMYELEGKIIF